MDGHKDNNRHRGTATATIPTPTTITTTTTNNRSMSDTDSQFDEFHSSANSPLQFDEFPSSPSKAIVSVDKYYTSSRSPTSNHQKPPQTFSLPPTAKAQSPTVAYNRSAREESVTGVTKVSPGGVEEGTVGGGGERRPRTASPGSRRSRREVMVDRAALGFRILEVILSVVAFSVMASDKTQGWSGDSFDRYKEYRYVVAVNAIGFAYAAFQAIDMAYHLIYGKHIISYSLRPHFDFLMDQILAYLLISASSSAATRVDDWVSNWGKDAFTEMATASIGMSFLAFVAFALSSLISGYNLCNQNSL
ncbi:CASP-like protein 4A3 [Cynara cardunculus var. scolymus]|uniref:CASP-like protein 4A3 n=1 Tax=Cynara cardunculus var. scolymus TaxID=59895 RepID=UPI000D628CCC|nr:CASP-like protein 4A3 [Cynara cardunculus var. scolymus]